MQIQVNTFCELIAFLAAILYYPYLKSSYMKWFLPFLIFIFLAELFANYQTNVLKENAVRINYLIAIIESIFYGYIFYRLNNPSFSSRVCLFFIPTSVVAYVVTYFICDQPLEYFFPNIIFSGFFIAMSALFYLYSQFLIDEETILISNPGFWIAFGVSLFYSGISISFSLHNVIKSNNIFLFGESLLNIVPRVLSVILYISISIAIILCKHQKKTSLSQS